MYDFAVGSLYSRQKSVKVEKNGNVITLHSRWKLQQEVKLKEIQLFAFSDMWVGK